METTKSKFEIGDIVRHVLTNAKCLILEKYPPKVGCMSYDNETRHWSYWCRMENYNKVNFMESELYWETEEKEIKEIKEIKEKEDVFKKHKEEEPF